jgi:hypothetical protein
VLHRRQCEIVENRFEHVADISKAEAKALDELGKELAAPASSWSEESDDEELERGSDPDNEEGQRRPSVIRVHQRPADTGWRIQVDRAIGVIGVNDLQINVVPKIPQAHFNHLAEIAIAPQRMRFGRESFKLQPDSSFLPSVWGAFLDALAITLRADLHHDYEERTDDPPYIRGRLDVRKTSINLSRGLLRFPAVFEDLTVDNPANRLLKAAAETVGSAAELAAPNGPSPQHDAYRNLITRAREMAYRMGDVGKLRPGDHDAVEPRLAVHQRDALQLARHILTGVGRSLTLGDVKVTCFLMTTPDLIERGVRTILDDKLAPEITVSKKPKVAARLRFQPDLVFEVAGDPPLHPRATGDVKYRIREHDWARSTLLQVMGFAQVFASPLSVFVDFSTAGAVPIETEKINDITYHHVSWPCSVDVTPEEAEQRVLSDVRRALSTS